MNSLQIIDNQRAFVLCKFSNIYLYLPMFYASVQLCSLKYSHMASEIYGIFVFLKWRIQVQSEKNGHS